MLLFRFQDKSNNDSDRIDYNRISKTSLLFFNAVWDMKKIMKYVTWQLQILCLELKVSCSDFFSYWNNFFPLQNIIFAKIDTFMELH